MTATFTWDSETFRFGPANKAPKPVCISAVRDGPAELWGAAAPLTADGAELWHCADPATWEMFARVLELALTHQCQIAGHNVAYDFACAMHERSDLIPAVFAAYDADAVTDTMLRMKLVDIGRGQLRGWTSSITGKKTQHNYALADVAARLCNIQLDKKGGERTSFGELYGLTLDQWPERHVGYALEDGLATHAALREQDREAPELLVDEWRQARAAMALHLAATWGIRTDEAAVRQLERDTLVEITRVRPTLESAGLLRANGSRNMKAAHALMEQAFPGCPRTPTGLPQVNEESCAESGHPILIALAEYGKAQNVLGKDVPDLLEGTVVPIHTWFDSLIDTGRTSSSRPNIQNIRRRPGIRECYVPRPGFVFASCDYDRAELHTLAEVCTVVFGRSVLGDMLNAGHDPHLALGARMLGISYRDALARKDDPIVEDARQKAKAPNFGVPGGLSATGRDGKGGLRAYAKSNYGIDFSEAEATAFRNLALEMYPEWPQYFEWIKQLCGPGGLATIRHLYSDRVRGNVPYTMAANGFFQGLCADMAKDALWHVARAEYAEPGSPLYGSRTVNFVHDEIICEVPDDAEAGDAAARELERIMVAVGAKWTPHVPVRASVKLMRRWSKRAKRKTDQWGHLIPYEDAT